MAVQTLCVTPALYAWAVVMLRDSIRVPVTLATVLALELLCDSKLVLTYMYIYVLKYLMYEVSKKYLST